MSEPRSEDDAALEVELEEAELEAASAGASERPTGASAERETTRHIRGSSLLLIGRALSLGINFVTQVLIVRALTPTDYGAFSYALSIVALAPGES